MDLSIEKLVPGGEGLARFDGKVVFVPGTLPGEKVAAKWTEIRKDYGRAEVAEILQASPRRVIPVCPVAGICGGCDWQHIEYAEQLRQKVALVEDSLRRIGGLSWPGLSIEAGPPLRYRNRVQFHRGPSGDVGFLARNSHTVISVASCPVAHPALDALLSVEAPARSVATTPVEQTDSTDTRSAAAVAPERFMAWAHSPVGQAYDVLESGESGQTAETKEITVDVLGRPVRFDLSCFFQSNLTMLEKLIPYALDGLEGRDAMDLYCGVGVFGVFLKERFQRIVAVEENPRALRYARMNLGADPHLFLEGTVEDCLRRPRSQLAQSKADAIVVDPPRTGLDVSVRNFLAEAKPSRLIYVSCNPVTMARDLKDLLAKGFRLDDLHLFDFYPQTSHVEAVAKLTA